MSRLKLGRRAVLRGIAAGGLVSVGLPLLEVMLNPNGTAHADGSALPSPFISWFFGNGVRLSRFEPTKVGANWDLSEELAPLANVKDFITVCTGLKNHCNNQITHHEGMTVFNGYSFTDWNGGLYSKAGGPTIDQVIADKIADKTPVKSIQVGVSKRRSIMDSGTTMFAMSHRGPNEPLYPEFNPQNVWQTLFGLRVDAREMRVNVLDSVSQDLTRLKARLGTADRQRVDAHLTGVAELQAKINSPASACTSFDKPTETNADIAGNEPIVNVNKVQSDLLVYALSCDITRVASLFFIGGAAETTYSDLGQTTGHHFNTHQASMQAQVHDGVVYQMQRLAYLLEKMKATVDPLGLNMLETSLVYISTDCSEGFTHSIDRQPIILAGHRRNKLIYPGIHYQAVPMPDTAGNTSDVLLSVLQAYDPAATSVGGDTAGSTTPLAAIKGSAA